MTGAWETVRTDRYAYRKDEAVPFWRKPKRCVDHQVQWWSDEQSVAEIMGRISPCPVCNGKTSLSLLVALEDMRT